MGKCAVLWGLEGESHMQTKMVPHMTPVSGPGMQPRFGQTQLIVVNPWPLWSIAAATTGHSVPPQCATDMPSPVCHNGQNVANSCASTFGRGSLHNGRNVANVCKPTCGHGSCRIETMGSHKNAKMSKFKSTVKFVLARTRHEMQTRVEP